jgi:hypothetical protein
MGKKKEIINNSCVAVSVGDEDDYVDDEIMMIIIMTIIWNVRLRWSR